ncbi:hypothetical protein Pmar_PMAR013652 [Perkinsus marinus ATCC 50983]|uniref:Uncharacterized protein n=1 Tax=Perkinsus marinus (strain ATCC 50983 / TXsc) TaxID=423536 RepID=C5LXX6_PERM5|nr:hypothetical protein Pmar_PMAR013652 [Perkinsus marinus ATCC 50983]EEQ98306.1 hypothetical protein Pmar_PMAR013652 [Perkinsus marinus ATCC 50983]|eukprot:XP_002765589.1 hypothetical protein Pmar_PMAR013652 [Perkinsus marinus ATCC 50983]
MNYDGVLPVSTGKGGELAHKLDFIVSHLCLDFIPQFFDLNPISNLSVLVDYDPYQTHVMY